MPEKTSILGGHRGEEAEGGVLQDQGVFFTFLPEAVLEISQDKDAGLSAVGRHALISLYCHDTHVGNCFGDDFGETAEATIFLEEDLDVRVLLQ